MAFMPYYSYTGSPKVSGKVAVQGTGLMTTATQTLSWQLSGVDPACKRGASPDIKNSCGLHIHQGTSCYDNALGHYWNTTLFEADPWATVSYTTKKFILYHYAHEIG